MQVIEIARLHLRPPRFDRKFIYTPLPERGTPACQRANRAIGRARYALQGSELHHRLVMQSRPRRIEQRTGQNGKLPLAGRSIDRRLKPV